MLSHWVVWHAMWTLDLRLLDSVTLLRSQIQGKNAHSTAVDQQSEIVVYMFCKIEMYELSKQ